MVSHVFVFLSLYRIMYVGPVLTILVVLYTTEAVAFCDC